MNINQRYFLGITIGGVMASCAPAGKEVSAVDDRMNILLITVEDISPMLGCYGDPVARTPVLDQLARDGVLFTNMFATVGVCAPARAALITGMYASSIGASHMRTNRRGLPDGIPPYEAVPPPEVKCYTEFLRAAGYYCTNNEKTDYQFKPPITAWDENGRTAHWRNRPDGMPFFSIFNITTSHESQVWDRANDPVVIHPDDVIVPPYYPDNAVVRRDIARVYSNNTIMDREVGEIINQLKEDGLYDNTIIVFYSDHGGPLPRQKREIYDSGLHVPFIIRFPGNIQAGSVVDELVSFVDIPPTMLSLAGIEPPDYMQGQAFRGDFRKEPRDYIFAARDRKDSEYDIRRAVRDHQYKYIRNYKPEVSCYQDIEFRLNIDMMQEMLRLRDAGQLNEAQMYWFRQTKEPEELYDLEQDPHELNDLARNPAYADVLTRMRVVHEQWMKDIDDKGLMTEKELVWSMWPGGIQPETMPPYLVPAGKKAGLRSDTEGASIAYMVNKNTPEPHKRWLLYHEPIAVNPGDTITAVAIRIGYKQSDEESFVVD
jgi:N-sulfoglucosamine sulfohydrolase